MIKYVNDFTINIMQQFFTVIKFKGFVFSL